MKYKYLILGALMLLLAIMLGACSTAPAATPCPEPPSCPECADCPECPTCPEPEAVVPVVEEAPFEEAWASSAHNDAEAEAFNHWNEDDPAEVPTACAKCHSSEGYAEYVTTGEVANNIPAPAGTIQCVACHNEATAVMDSVTFMQTEVTEEGGEPENVVISGLGPEARCMVCHQGRGSTSTVNATLESFGATEDLDTVPAAVDDSSLGFINIHYFPAAATMYGTLVKGGYQYDGKSYDAKNDHVTGYDTCVGCHNPHTLERKLDECAVCHQGVASDEDVRNIRMAGSKVDYDGDGDVEEGVAFEIEGLQEALYQNIQAYATEVAGKPIVYNAQAYPYFFIDANEDGEAGEDEESYDAWTGRLVQSAYNYQMSVKDPGAFAHGGKYIIQLLYDSVEDLNQAVSSPVDMTAMNRIDNGHFAGSEEAFRHWDEEGGVVPGSCSKCHSAAGLPFYLAEGVTASQHATNGLKCDTCHNDLTTFTRYGVESVQFPSGATLTLATGDEAVDSNVCIQCHQGRESTISVNRVITGSGAGDDEVSDKLSFRNPHYFAAGATLFGSDAQGAYQYEGKEYNRRNMHVPGFQACADCHDVHALSVKVEACGGCHPVVKSAEDLESIRVTPGDFDGDGDETEGIAGEVDTMADKLYEAIQAYAAANGLPGIVYDGASYPYFFDEAGESYASWTPTMVRAAFNYQWTLKDPGAFAHNAMYMLQVLYDSIQDIGGDVSGMIRPEVKVSAEQ